MKVMAINGSPHKAGSTYAVLYIMKEELERAGIQMDIFHVGNQNVKGCIGCHCCKHDHPGRCVMDGDIVNEMIAKTKEYDGLVIGSPVYYSGIAGNMKCFLDRFFFAGPDLKKKAAAAVTAQRRSGGVPTFQQLCNYLNLSGAVIVPTQYWNSVYGTDGSEILQDHEGVEIAANLGRNMAWLMKVLEAGMKVVPKPQYPRHVATNFIRK